MFNSNYLNHLLQFIRHNPINSNSIKIIKKMWLKIKCKNKKVVLIEFILICGILRGKRLLQTDVFFLKHHIHFFTNLKFVKKKFNISFIP